MANQVVVTNSGNVQVSIEPTPNVQVQISRAAIGNITVSNVSTANFANYAGNVVNANQPNITSLGTLTGLTSSGNITAPFFLGNVIGNISGNLVVPGSNTSVLYNNQGNAGASDAFKFDQASNTVTILGNLVGGNISGNGAGIANITGANVTGQVAYANVANNVAGGNVSGQVAYAAVANSVAVGNVSGIGNIATVNLDGNASNVLFGNGVFAPVTISNVANANYANFANVANTANSVAVSNVVGIGNIATVNLDGNVSNVLSGNGTFVPLPTVSANANYANFAGTAFNVSGSNVTGEVANAAYANSANTANLATYATTANSVAVGNVVGIGNIATTNYDGNASNILYGNGGFYALPTISNVANANYANFAGVAYSVSGSNVSGEVANANYASYAGNANVANTANTVAGANVTGTVANANYAAFSGVANSANSVAGANVTGTVANANYASFANVANTANSVAVGNVVGIGNIATINLDGNASNALLGNGAFGPLDSTQSIIANGTSNVSIPAANGNINFSANGNANLVILETTGQMNSSPLSTATSVLRINSIGNPLSDAHRITWFRSRGTVAVPTSVQANDLVMSMVGLAHNGTAYNTSFPLFIRGVVDSTYTANTANVPMGLRFTVAQTTQSGSSNAAISHNFHSNGNVSFAQTVNAGNLSITGNANIGNIGTAGLITATGNITGGNLITGGTLSVTGNANVGNLGTAGLITATGNIRGGNLITTGLITATGNITGGNLTIGSSSANSTITLNGDKTVNSSMNLTDAQFSVISNNVPNAGGYSPFRFQYFDNTSANINPIRNFRARGILGSANYVIANDEIFKTVYSAYADSGNTTVQLFENNIVITQNDLAGNILANYNITPSRNASNIVLGGGNTFANILRASYLYGDGSNITNISSNAISATYGAFYNPNDIAITANTVANLDLPQTSANSGVSIASNNRITVTKAGTYNLQLSLQLKNTDNAADHDFDFWFAKNGTDIANSATQLTVVKNDGKNVAVVNFIDQCAANDYYQVRYAASSANISLETFPALTTPYVRPAIPSAIVTIVPVGS